MRKLFISEGLLFACLFVASVQATDQWRIDLDGSSNGSTASGYSSWSLSTTATSTSKTFTNSSSGNTIACTMAQTYPTNVDPTVYLKFSWLNKNGQGKYNLSFDGGWVHQKNDALVIDRPYTNGGAFSLSISNLPAGPHTITTYHNDVWGVGTNTSWINTNNYAMSKCIISVDGVPLVTNTPSLQVTNDNFCGFAYFTVNAVDGQPVVINFDPDHSGALDFVILNGFEIDRPNPGFSALNPVPANNDEHVAANNDSPGPNGAATGYTTLSWTPSAFAVSNDVYFGSVSNNVLNATHASPEFKGTMTATNYNVTNLDSRLTYFWRVDEINAGGGVTNVSKGDLWRFRTRHLAFATAEGYGRFSRGGRGGVVMEVTNLLDYNSNDPVIPGSYRAAIEATGPRTVVFRVSGLIRFLRPCTINSANGYITIAGQTAPGEGICLANWRAGISSCSDVNMRFIRCRLGDASQQAMDGIGLGNSTHSIIDHCSISWTIDEASSSRQSGAVGSATAMTTFQHNVISEPLQHSYHYNDSLRASTGCTNCYQQHAFAASISGEIASYHHNLIAHSTDRNWSLAGGLDASSHYAGSLDIRNNVVYNWIGRSTDGGVQRANYVSNYYKPYPPNPYASWLLRLDPINSTWGIEWYYMAGNVMEGKNYFTNNWAIGSAVATGNGSNDYASVSQVLATQTNSEIFPSYVNSQSASNAYKLVLSDVGCNLPLADVIDRRIVGEVLNGNTHYEGTNGPTYIIGGVPQTGSANYPGIIDAPTDVHDAIGSPNYPWPAYNTYNVPFDTDHDGMPDWWELIKGTNPNSAPGDYSDSNGDPDNDGYSNLEDYLNWLASPHVDCARNLQVDVDLTQFARGFTNSSYSFTVSNPTNGSVSLLPGGKVARYTPTAGFYGLGGYQFAVTDTAGLSMTNVMGVHVLAMASSQMAISGVGPTTQLQFTGQSGFYYLIQYSDDLANWTTWTNVTATGAAQPLTPPGLGGVSKRFWRSVSVQ